MMRRALFGLPAAFLGVTSPGDKLRRPQNAPYGQQTPIGIQPGTNGVTIAHYVIVTGAAGGVFLYVGTPAFGNPPAEYMTTGTVDPYGNTLVSPGIVSNSSTAVAMNNGILSFYLGSTLAGALTGANSPAGSGFVIELTTPGGFWSAGPVYTGSGITAIAPGGGAETWHPMTLLNSWANNVSFTASRYRLMPDNSVRVQGVINATAATAATFFTLPAGYVPASSGGAPVGCNAGAGASTVPTLRWDTSGNLTINNLTIPSASAVFFTQDIPLD